MRVNLPLIGLLVVFVAGNVRAELALPAIFGDHMVLQADKPVAVWGRADAGQQVTVTIADQSHDARADDAGQWRVELAPLHAGESHTLAVTAGDVTRTFSDVLVGEVWLCSGQSNMDMRLMKVADADAEIARATQPTLRLFYVERAITDTPADDVEGRWVVCNPSDARKFSAVSYFMGRALQEELGTPIGLIHSAYGGTPAEAWISGSALSDNPALAQVLARWERRVNKYTQALAGLSGTEAAKVAAPPERYMPAGLYNGMIDALAPFTLRGVAWYQGESNSWRGYEYRDLLPTLIADWRQRWGDDALPFGVVQLPNYNNPPRVPRAEQSWEELREAQLLTVQNTPHTGLVVTIDIGNAIDVHPTNKQDVGRRLALWALGAVYGRDVVYSGPTFREAAIEGNKVTLHLDHIGGGLATRDGGPVRGVVIAGKNGKFRWASNVEIHGNTLVVWDAKISKPASVRYAWDDNPDWANLINVEGLPASPFRTDDWPGVTGP